MTWNEVEAKYEECIAKRVPGTYRSGKTAFIKLEKALRKYYPDAIARPEILADMDERVFRFEFTRNLSPHITKNSVHALEILRNIISITMHIDSPDKSADLRVFRKKDVTACFAKWLISKEWKIIKMDYFENSRLDVIAERNGRFITAAAIGSAWKMTESWRDDERIISGTLKSDIIAFKNRLGKALVTLMEELNKNPETMPVLLIADDAESREHFMPYLPHIRKINITLYRVKSADEVNEI